MSAQCDQEGLTSQPDEDIPASSPRPGSLRELLIVALPLILSAGSLSLMNVIDRVFLTWYSTDALAAASPAGMLHWTAMSLVIGTASCVTTFVAQFEGARRKERVASAVWQGIWLSFTAGLIFLCIVPFSPQIFAWAGHTPAVQKLEVEYFGVLCYGAIPMTLCTVLGGFYSGRGKTMTVMAVNITLAITNVTLDWFLIQGRGPFPELGMRGAAIATVIAYIVATTLYFLLISRPAVRQEYKFWSAWRIDPELFQRLIKVGLPTGGQFFADIAAFTLFLIFLGRLGPIMQKASNLAFNLNGLAFVPLMGLATAVMSLVGRRIGEGRPHLASRTVWWAMTLGGGWMLSFGAMYMFAPDFMLLPYAYGANPTDFAPIRAETIRLLKYVAWFAFFDSMVVIFGSAVRGAGDTRFPLACTIVTSWLLLLIPVAIADALGKNSLTLSWSLCTGAIMIGGFTMMFRFLRGRWKSMSVIDDMPTSRAEKPLLAKASAAK